MEILFADEKEYTKRHSSIDQYNGFLNVVTRGGATPILFDSLDGITCEKVHSHPIIISFGDDIGYHYDDAHCRYASDMYYYFDRETTELKPLECWFGEGFYESYSEGTSFVNFDDASLGLHNEKELRIGTDYVLADEILPAID